MKHPYRAFLAGVVVPAILAVLVGNELARASWRELTRTTESEVARIVLRAFLMETHGPTGAAARAVAADSAVSLVSEATGYAAALYRDGRRLTSAPPTFGPRVLDAAVLHDLAGRSGGLPVSDGEVVATPGPSTNRIAALAASPTNRPAGAVPLRIRLVVGLLMLFAGLAGWIQLGRPQGGAVDGREQSPPGGVSVVLLALVPTLTAVLFLGHLETAYRSAARDATGRDLALGLAVAATHGLLDSARSVRALTGFDATRIRAGVVEETTLEGDATPLAALPAPPPSFTSSGTVRMSGRVAVYAAWGAGGGAVMTLTAPDPAGPMREFDARADVVGGALVLWLLLFGVAVVRRGSRRSAS